MRVNQKVKVKTGLRSGMLKDGCLFIQAMERYCGKVATITGINTDHKYIKLSGSSGIGGFSWKEDWLNPFIENFLTDKDFEI